MPHRRLVKASLQRLAGALVVSALLGTAAAQSANPPSAAGQIREIFELSGLRPMLETVGLQLDELVNAQTSYPPLALDMVRNVVTRHYSPGALEAAIVPRMRAKEDPALGAATLVWLRSPMGRKITALDTSASSMEASVAIHFYVDELDQHPAPPERLAIVDRIIAATHYTEARTDIGLSIMETLILALDATQPPELRTPPDEVRAKIASTRAEALVEGQDLSRAAMLYTYRSLDSSQLQELLRFAESPAGRWFHDMLWRSAKEALDAIAIETYAEVVAEVERYVAAQQP